MENSTECHSHRVSGGDSLNSQNEKNQEDPIQESAVDNNIIATEKNGTPVTHTTWANETEPELSIRCTEKHQTYEHD